MHSCSDFFQLTVQKLLYLQIDFIEKMENLRQIGIVPVDYGVLCSIYSNYSYPRNKIAGLEQEGKLIRLKRGIYVVSPGITGQLLSRELIANHIYGPSYVSMESALRYYGLIPEQVYIVRSMTINRSRKFLNPVGYFEYITVPDNYYPIGISQQISQDKYTFLIASPEKALCDMIVATPGLRLQSEKALMTYLEKDLRFDMSALETMDPLIIEKCAETGRKKPILRLLLKRIRL